MRRCAYGCLHVRRVVVGQEVEGDERGRRRLGQLADPLLGRVDALGQGVELEARRARDDDFAVEHASGRELAPQRLDQLGEVAGEGLLVAAAQLDLVPVAEDDAAEAVPLRLVVQPVALGELAGQLGQHRRDRWHHGERQRPRLRLRSARRGRGRARSCVRGRRPRPGVRRHWQPIDDALGRDPALAAFSQPVRATRAARGRGRRCRRRTSTRVSTARRSRSSGGSWRSGRELISTAVPVRAQAAKTASASKVDWGRPLPAMSRPVQWPRMSVCGLSTAATMRAGHLRRLHAQFRVDAGHDDVECAEELQVLVQRPSSRMSTSIPVRMRNGASSSFSSATTSSWAQAFRVEAVGHGETRAVVGQDEVVVAQPRGRLGHLADGAPPSDQSEWLWQSPRSEAEQMRPPCVELEVAVGAAPRA